MLKLKQGLEQAHAAKTGGQEPLQAAAVMTVILVVALEMVF